MPPPAILCDRRASANNDNSSNTRQPAAFLHRLQSSREPSLSHPCVYKDSSTSRKGSFLASKTMPFVRSCRSTSRSWRSAGTTAGPKSAGCSPGRCSWSRTWCEHGCTHFHLGTAAHTAVHTMAALSQRHSAQRSGRNAAACCCLHPLTAVPWSALWGRAVAALQEVAGGKHIDTAFALRFFTAILA